MKVNLRLLFKAPAHALDWYRLLRAADRRQWKRVFELLDSVHRRAGESPESLYWLGTAHLMEGRPDQAISALERIGVEPLSNEGYEASRHLNHAAALLSLGRRKSAVELLLNSLRVDWPAPQRKQAGEMLARLGIGEDRVEEVLSMRVTAPMR